MGGFSVRALFKEQALSSLTKVFAVLVSLSSIFLCGLVVVFVTNKENYKDAWEQERQMRMAAQVQAVAAEEYMSQSIAHYKAMDELKNGYILQLEQQSSDRLAQLAAAIQARAQAESKSAIAVALSKSLQETLDNMYAAQMAIQKELNIAHDEMITAQTQVIEVRRELDKERVKSNVLETSSKEYLEKIHGLENENAQIRQELQAVRLTPSEFREMGDQVALVELAVAGVPIRGVIKQLDDDLAALSVGSSSGVRESMRFRAIRGDQYLGDLVIMTVEPTESVGRVVRKHRPIVAGDVVSTGFD